MKDGTARDAFRLSKPFSRSQAFTLIELLVIVAIVAVLAVLCLPVLTSARQRATDIMCLSNMQRLTAAWNMYAVDNGGHLAVNVGANAPLQDWTMGLMSWNGANSDNTNLAKLTAGLLGKYTANDLAIYHCPADTSAAPGQGLRVRSVSMNACVGIRKDSSSGSTYSTYVQFNSLSDFTSPSQVFVTLDEHPDSLNDGLCEILVSDFNTNTWGDLPAAFHNGAGSFSFADGHAELHKWLDSKTRLPVTRSPPPLPFAAAPGQAQDINWTVEHMSVRR
jgi:prepilin-type processing-associated H-X9-DG protein